MHFSTSPILSVGDPYKRVILTRSLLGKVHFGEITRTSSYFPRPELIAALPEEATEQAKNLLSAQQGVSQRLLVRTGNFEMTNEHFNWVSDFEMRSRTEPEWAVLFERLTWGRFYGLPKAFLVDGASIAESPEAVWNEFNRYHHEVRERWKQRRALEIKIIGKVDHALEKGRLKLRGAGEVAPLMLVGAIQLRTRLKKKFIVSAL